MRKPFIHALLRGWYFSDFRTGLRAFFSLLSQIRIETGTPLMFCVDLYTKEGDAEAACAVLAALRVEEIERFEQILIPAAIKPDTSIS